MTRPPTREEVIARVLALVRERFLDGDPGGELDEDTPLLEYGVLNSLKIAVLAGRLADDFAVEIPFTALGPATWETVRGIGSMVHGLTAAGGT